MTDDPSAHRRLDVLYATAMVAHEAVYDAYRQVVDRGRDDDAVRELVAESARITLQEWPTTLATARELAARVDEQALLDPDAVIETRRAFEAELQALAPQLERLLAREREIHQMLRLLANE